MSLINQMLQDLDARGTPGASAGVLQGQVRAVPERRRLHPAWWLVLLLASALCAGAGWIWFGRSVPATPSSVVKPVPELPLKMDSRLSVVPAMAATPIAAAPDPEPHSAPTPAGASVTPRLPDLPVTGTATPAPVATPLASAVPTPNVMAPAPATTEPSRGVTSSAPLPAKVTVLPALAAGTESSSAVITKQSKELTPLQRAENDYRRGATLIQQGKPAEAIAAMEQALQLDSRHAAARQTLVGLLLDARRHDEALRRLREGLQADGSQTGLAMILARLQVDRGELKPAIETLQRSLPHALDRADYQAFLAALLQRDSRHKEAVEHYSQAVRRAPQNGLWWMGLGISLQADNRVNDAIEAFGRAKASDGLSAELKAFVDEKLNNLQR